MMHVLVKIILRVWTCQYLQINTNKLLTINNKFITINILFLGYMCLSKPPWFFFKFFLNSVFDIYHPGKLKISKETCLSTGNFLNTFNFSGL